MSNSPSFTFPNITGNKDEIVTVSGKQTLSNKTIAFTETSEIHSYVTEYNNGAWRVTDNSFPHDSFTTDMHNGERHIHIFKYQYKKLGDNLYYCNIYLYLLNTTDSWKDSDSGWCGYIKWSDAKLPGLVNSDATISGVPVETKIFGSIWQKTNLISNSNSCSYLQTSKGTDHGASTNLPTYTEIQVFANTPACETAEQASPDYSNGIEISFSFIGRKYVTAN